MANEYRPSWVVRKMPTGALSKSWRNSTSAHEADRSDGSSSIPETRDGAACGHGDSISWASWAFVFFLPICRRRHHAEGLSLSRDCPPKGSLISSQFLLNTSTGISAYANPLYCNDQSGFKCNRHCYPPASSKSPTRRSTPVLSQASWIDR